MPIREIGLSRSLLCDGLREFPIGMGHVQRGRRRDIRRHDLSAGRVEPFEIGPFTETGEYIIDDSTDPGEHGSFKIVVE